MAGLGKAQPKETVWANYKLIGTLWLQACTLQPGVSQLETQGVAFDIPPVIRFAGQPGEQGTMFFRDPSGNPIEVKGFADMASVFAH